MKVKKFLMYYSLFLCFLFGINLFAYVYYIPHIHTGSDAWETYLIFNNSENSPQAATVYYYDSTGALINTQTYTVNEYGEKEVFLRTIGAIAAKVYTSSSFLRVRLGYIAKEELGGGTAEFAPATKLYSRMIMNTSNYYSQLTWSGFALWNATNKEISVTLTAYSEEEKLAEKTITMQPYEKIVDFFDSFFGVDNFQDIFSVRVDTDSPSLTGVVISGKDNDKLLFSAPMGFDRYSDHSEIVEGSVYATNSVYTNGDGKYHAFICAYGSASPKAKDVTTYYHISWNLYGLTDSFFANPVDYGIAIQYIAASEDGNAIYILGTKNGHFVVKKIDVTGDDQNEWEVSLASAGYSSSLFFDPMDIKIRGCEINGSFFVVFKDKDNNFKVERAFLDANTGNVTADYQGLTETTQIGDIIEYQDGSNKRALFSFSYYTDKLQLIVYDENGHQIKQIFGASPIPDSTGKQHMIFSTMVLNNKVLMVVGKAENIDQGLEKYHIYLVSVDLGETNFSNATVTDLGEFLPHGSSCAMFNSLNFNGKGFKVSFPYTIQIMTLPYLDFQNGTTMLVNATSDGTPLDYCYFKRDLPYNLKSVVVGLLGVYVIGGQDQFVTYDTYNTKLIMRLLYLDEVLDY